MPTYSSKSYKLRDKQSVRRTTWKIAIQRGKKLLYQNQSHQVYHIFWMKQSC